MNLIENPEITSEGAPAGPSGKAKWQKPSLKEITIASDTWAGDNGSDDGSPSGGGLYVGNNFS